MADYIFSDRCSQKFHFIAYRLLDEKINNYQYKSKTTFSILPVKANGILFL
jgi:hypothetical protein